MLRATDSYFQNLDEPAKSCLLFLRSHILAFDEGITEAWKYRMPFYCYKGKMICYFWVHKKYRQPYIGIVEGKLIADPDLITEKRARMKILLLDPSKDIPVEKINSILKTVIAFYR
jgi:hypothetical protein